MLADNVYFNRSKILKPADRLRKTTLKRQISSEGIAIKALRDTKPDSVSSLAKRLALRPSEEELLKKNIIKEVEGKSPAEKIMMERNKLKKALLKRPSVFELAEKKIIKEQDLLNQPAVVQEVKLANSSCNFSS